MKLREIIIKLLRSEAMNADDLRMKLRLSYRDKKIIKRTLTQLSKEGVIFLRNGKYVVSKDTKKIKKGEFSQNRKGFGFLRSEKGDYYIPNDEIHGAMDGDMVEASVTERGRSEGVITKILTRKHKTLVGIFFKEKQHGVFSPDNPNIPYVFYIPRGSLSGAKAGDKVAVSITKYPDGKKMPRAVVKEIIGSSTKGATDMLSVISRLEIPDKFPEDVISETEVLPLEVSPADLVGRKDFTSLNAFTIDGADAKDFDDAVSIEKLPNGNYSLGVHIADVSHYVKENSALDKEALNRGNSVYLLSKVCPMLPTELSNELCSLNENVIRLTFSVIMEFDKDGEFVKSELSNSYIKSRKRLIYDEVSDLLERGKSEISYINSLSSELFMMKGLYEKLNIQRLKRGAVDFDIPESEIKLDENDFPIDLKRAERRIANKMIEEFMLAANESVAKIAIEKKLPFVFRVHEEPDSERIFKLSLFLSRIGLGGLRIKDRVKPKEVQKLIEKSSGTKWEGVVSMLTLRSMAKAKYFQENLGHFGLALDNYVHFTSPIRRYSDLLIHRILKEGTSRDIPKVCEWISYTERRANEAEMEIKALKIAQYMSKFEGEIFEGTISSVTSFGIFVSLENTAEGLIRYDSEHEYFDVDEDIMTATGFISKRTYRPGDKVRVRLKSVNIERRELNFGFIEEGAANGKRKKRR